VSEVVDELNRLDVLLQYIHFPITREEREDVIQR